MGSDVNDDDIRAIKALIARQFESLSWTSAEACDWAAFAAGFLSEASLYPSARPAKRMVEALAQSEERYSRAVEAMNESLYDWNLADGTIFFSPRMLALFGRTPEEMCTSADWVALIHPDDMSAHRQVVIDHLKARTPRLVTEYRYRHGDGTWRWARQHGLAQRDETGRGVRMVGSSSDITEEKQLAAALRASEARYAQAMAAIGEGLYEWDIARDQVYHSDSLYQMLNLRREDLRTASDWLDRIHPDDLRRFKVATAEHLVRLVN